MEHKIVLGADIGGSHITSVLIDLNSNQFIEGTYQRVHVDSSQSSEKIIQDWTAVLSATLGVQKRLVKHIGLAVPGPFDYRKGISMMRGQNKFDSLYGLDVKGALAESLEIPKSSIKMINDAAAFIHGEICCGSIQGFTQAVGVTLGTGLGTSFGKDGSGYDAKLWKMPFMGSFAEEYLSTRWFVKRYFELTGIVISDVKEMVQNGNDVARIEVFREFSRNLAAFLHRFLLKKNAHAVVIGGSIAKASDLFLKQTRALMAGSMGYSVPVHISELGENAALIGAAYIGESKSVQSRRQVHQPFDVAAASFSPV